MSWIQVDQTLREHGKLWAFADELSISRVQAIGHLTLLWWWALDNADAVGDAGEVSDRILARAAEWPEKQAGKFVRALVAARFLDEIESGKRFHNWDLYSGGLHAKKAKQREDTRLRVAKLREEERLRNALRNGHVTVTDFKRNAAREEKSTEEKRRGENGW